MKKFQRCLFFHCGDASREGSDKSAKVALDAVVDLYGRGVWTCAPTVNCVGAPLRAAAGAARAQKDKFEIRVAMMDLISRVACAHKLALLPPATTSPPDELVAAARKIADAFVSERNAPEAMALGINALREVAGRCPALLDEPEMLGFVARPRGPREAPRPQRRRRARGWINVVREHYPALLHKKDRGRAHAASTREPAKYGAATAATAVEGEELLRAYERGDLPEDFDDAVRECDGVGEGVKDDDGAGWDEDDEEEEEGEDDDEEEAGEDDEDDGEEDEEGGWEEASDDDDDGEDGDEGWQDASDDGEAAAPAAKKLRAAGGRAGASGQGFLQSNDILPDAVKRKTSVEERKAQNVLDREQYQLKTHAGGKTNTEKRRTKNYLMVQKKKARTNGLKKRTRAARPREQLSATSASAAPPLGRAFSCPRGRKPRAFRDVLIWIAEVRESRGTF
ncbi:SDA1 domain-containing protein [Aureococcus anophagefferens]|uniref:Protein SDA1 n=1 Tax=Aureococcus anophagefferens TaxID=44056 RepID=A0ABR1G6J1_AURAN